MSPAGTGILEASWQMLRERNNAQHPFTLLVSLKLTLQIEPFLLVLESQRTPEGHSFRGTLLSSDDDQPLIRQIFNGIT
jgi:hypothetical protein